MASTHRMTVLLLLTCAVPAASLAACGSDNGGSGEPGGTGAGSGTNVGGAGGTGLGAGGGTGGDLFSSGPGQTFEPAFPEDPIVETSAPANAPELFGADPGSAAGGPCMFEPESNALFPRNWLRPRFRFTPVDQQNLFEIRLHTDDEAHDLVVYTADAQWAMPKEMWERLAARAVSAPLAVKMTVRGAVFDGTTLTVPPSTGTAGEFLVAPAQAEGAIVYWTTSGSSALKGFQIGDENVATTLTPPQVQMPTTNNAPVTCIGCHTSTPDGKFVGFTAQGPWSNVLASIEEATAGAQPSFMGAGALAALTGFSEVGIHSYSKAHWEDGDRVMVAPLGTGVATQLIWVDLEAQASGEGVSYGVMARDGDTHGAGSPTWSHDGQTVVYVSNDTQTTGRLDAGHADLVAVPYNDRLGGTVTPIPGASYPEYAEYYPAFSSDDALLAFNRFPVGPNMYDQPLAELFVIPAQGGDPLRLAANDPVSCTGKVSPGVTNSWPKWAPEATTVGGKTYYWLIYSSKRGQGVNPQLYVTGVVADGNTVQSFASVYLWNQPEAENNHTPAWDVFKIPPASPPQ
ncbi:TolB family protein [Chondromyces apiculatus]|uniref:TolB protein n=1 Tax=Chondromyces apiculatus DSM 436 TaxID=1192034 RepID=A0A017TDV7_9BACT|nr:PD40 domain-containing protein [Chondromyces apiculatus]EYF06801.1 Hypothetical protein CAP_1498 [Chondromyces apiculatus DSM 436]